MLRSGSVTTTTATTIAYIVSKLCIVEQGCGWVDKRNNK